MNNFTKDELRKILEGLGKLPYRWNGFKKGWNSDLEVKIQSLIDNYCEHVTVCEHKRGFECSECHSFRCRLCEEWLIDDDRYTR